jgi:hypothetical protein
MAWRLHLTDRSVRKLEILAGKPNVLAAWTLSNRVTFLDLQNGNRIEDRTIEAPATEDRSAASWRAFVNDLTAPNGVYLPIVRANPLTIYQTIDGKYRLYRISESEWHFAVDEREQLLEIERGTKFIAVAFDAESALIAALDREARLHVYRQGTRTGMFDSRLSLTDELQPRIEIAGGVIYVSDGQRLASFQPDGAAAQRLTLAYAMGDMGVSPDGHFLAAADLDANVIRVYDGHEFTALYQRFAVDLLADAKKTQLLASAGTTGAAIGSLALTNKGVVAFALSGMVCATSLARMKPVPRQAVSN